MYILAAAGVVYHILRGQQNLRDRDAVFQKHFIINVHQLTLTDGGGRLLHAQLGRSLRQTELLCADADGAG